LVYALKGGDTEEEEEKLSSKGIQKENNEITKERFQNVSKDSKYQDTCINRGFSVIDNHMITYTQEK
jgi:hypothetical protein